MRHWRRSDCISCWATSVNFVEAPPIRVLVFCQIYFGQVWVSEYMYYFVRKIINFFVTRLHVMWTDRSWVYIVVFKFPKQIKNCKHQCYMDIDDVLVQQMNFQQICFNCTYIYSPNLSPNRKYFPLFLLFNVCDIILMYFMRNVFSLWLGTYDLNQYFYSEGINELLVLFSSYLHFAFCCHRYM